MSELLNIVGIILAAGAVYGGIRADLRGMHQGLQDVKESATAAHRRIDGMLERHR